MWMRIGAGTADFPAALYPWKVDAPPLKYVSEPSDLERMKTEVRALNINKGWRDEERSFGDMIALLHSEVSEALEAYRDNKLADMTGPPVKGYMRKPGGVGSELADVLIRLLDMADLYGIDLQAEYERKMAFNWTRPYRHGGRTL
jgi:NTP pyrophosphatase (non-canonical NTP hydrolase)